MKSPVPRSRLLRRTAALAAATLAVGLTISIPAADGAPEVKAVKTDEPGVTANLWEWNWRSIRQECSVLADLGYDGVQVAPPQNSMKRTTAESSNPGGTGSTVLHPWWEVYQPVTYDLTSRMGTEAQFKAMVKACRKEGVKVYVDAVINHTTGQGSTSYGGQNFTPYNYPDIPYGPNDFHVNTGECSTRGVDGQGNPTGGGIEDFNNKNQVFKCNLVGLEDLDTDSDKVQAELAGYLNKLIGYGVSGFRVDAAKHVGQDDLDGIYSRLNRTLDGVKPYWTLEVFQGGPGVLTPQAFTKSGDVLGLPAAEQISSAFKSYPAEKIGSLATLEVFGTGSGLTKSSKTMSFVTNHDTDRNGPYLKYKDGPTFILANQWLLAQGYGSPQVYSSFTWEAPANPPANATPEDKDGRNQSPPSNANGLISDTDCSNGKWTCDHRNKGIVAMIKWRDYVGKAKRANWYTDEANVIAFSKGNRGWAAFNNGTAPKEIRVQTGLAKGTYCDIIIGVKVGGSCAGATVSVNSTGFTTVTIPAKGAVAFKKNDRVSGQS